MNHQSQRWVVVCAVTARLIATGSPTRAQDQPVWFWLVSCGGPPMELEVRVDASVVYRATVPLCHADRNSPPKQTRTGPLTFLIRPQRAIRWVGYADGPLRTAAGQRLAMDLWQAGAESSGVIIGVSVSDKRRIYMNTLHIAAIDARRETEIAKGIMVATYPALRK